MDGLCQSSAIGFQIAFLPVLPVQTSQKSGSSERGCCDLGRSFIFTSSGSSDAQPKRMAFCEGKEGSSRSNPLRLSGTRLWTNF